MGAGVSAVDGRDLEATRARDEELLEADGRIFDPGFVIAHTQGYKPPEAQAVHVQTEANCAALGLGVDEDAGRVQAVADLMQTIDAIADEAMADQFAAEQQRLMFLHYEMLQAFQRQGIRDRNLGQKTSVQVKRVMDSKPRLATSTKLGLQSVVRLLLILIDMARRSDKSLISQILKMASTLVSETPVLSLSDDSVFSSDIVDVIGPIIHFVRDVAVGTDMGSSDDTSKLAVEAILGFAMARGSLSLLLSVVNILLDGCLERRQREYNFGHLLRALHTYQPVPRSEVGDDAAVVALASAVSHIEIIDGNSEASDNARNGRSSTVRPPMSSVGLHSTDAPSNLDREEQEFQRLDGPRVVDWPSLSNVCEIDAVLIIMSELDRLCCCVSPSSMSDLSRSLPDDATCQGRGVVQHPLCLDVSAATFTELSLILEKCNVRVFSGGIPDHDRTVYLRVVRYAIRLLKLHLFQQAKSGIPREALGVAKEDMIRLRKQVLRHVDRSADSAGKSSLSVIADEATQAFAIGLQFFCSSAHEQIVYLTDLLDKRVANYARGQYAKDLPDSAHPENNLLNMLLSRFSSVHAAIALIEDTRNERESLRKVVSSLLSLCVTSAVSLDAKAEQTCRTSAQPGQREALRILQNLQKALLGLSGKRHYDAAICYRYGDHPLPELGIVCEYAELAFRSAESVLVKVLLELEQFSGTDPQSFYLHRFSGLQQTLIGQLVRPLCCGLLALIHVNLPKLSSCIIHVLAGCLRAADRICSFLDGQGCLHSVSIVSEKRVVETEHPLPRNMDRQFRLSIPYASSLSLAFDSRSCTSSSDDFVQLLTSSHNAFVPVTERIWGPNVQPQFAVDSAAAASLWPSEPLKVSGDTVIVHVKTGDSSDASPATSGWGVSVTATASVETKPLAWFLDLSKTMANLLSVCGDTLIGTKIKTTAEDANCQWLSGLLFGGLRTSLSISSEDFAHSIPEISQVIYDLATNSNGEDACSLLDQEFEFVEQQVLKLVGRSGLNLPSDLDRLCFAVALHHCGITDMLRKDFNDCELLASDTGVLHLRLSEVHGSTGTIVDLLHDISRHSSRVSEQISKFAAQCDAGSDAGSVIARCKERLRFLLRVHPSPKNCVFTRENGSFREKEIPEGYAPFKSSSIVSSWDAVVIRCFNEVSAFVFDLENDLCAVHECLCVRHVRGFNRLLGLHVISNMISELHTDDLVTDVLRQVRFRCPTSDIVPSGESPDSSAISRLGRSSSRHPSDAIRAILSRSVAGWQSRRFPQTLADLARACAAHDADTVPALLTLENFPLLLPTGIPGFPHRPAPNESPSDVPEVLSLRQPVDVSTSEAGDNIASAESSSMKPSSAICLATVVEQNSSAHYLYGLDGCEIKMRGAVRDCFFSVISQLVGRPRKTAQQYLKLMDLCTFPYCGRDLDHLLRTGIVDSLSPLLAYPACNAGILGVPKGLSDLLREGRLRLMPWNVRFCAWSLFRVLLYVSCTQTKPTSAIDIGLGQVDSSSMGILVGKVAEQVNLLCVMRSFEVNAASGDIKNAFQYHREIARNNGNDLMMDKTGSAPDAYVWQCHTCTFINGIQWNACRACGSPPSAMSYNGQTGAHNTSSSRSVFTEFCYESDFDENGVVFALGTNNITGPRASNVTFKNPAETGAVKIRYASLAATSVPATAIVGRTAVRCVSAAAENQWFIVDFLGRLIRPTYYTLRHYSSYNVEALRSWRLEGSSDGVSWTWIRVHDNDDSLQASGQSFSWPLECADFYSMFRILMTGPNSNNTWYLALSGFEIYGTLCHPQSVLDDRLTPGLPISGNAPFNPVIHDAVHSSASSSSLSGSDYWEVDGSQDIEFIGSDRSRPDSVCNQSDSQNWQVVRSAKSYLSGVCKLQVRIDNSGETPNTWKIVIGVVPTSFETNYSVSRCVGGTQGGWGYVAATGSKYHSSSAEKYGDQFSSGDVIGIILDFDMRTIEFLRNGVSQGIAFRNLSGPVRLAASFTAMDTRITMLHGEFAGESSSGINSGKVPGTDWDTRAKLARLLNAPVNWHIHQKADVGYRGSYRQCSPSLSQLEIDLFVNEKLSALLRCSNQAEFTSQLWRFGFLQVLAQHFSSSSMVTRVLSLRLYRRMIAFDAANVDAIRERRSSSIPNLGDTLDRLWDICGQNSMLDSSVNPDGQPDPSLTVLGCEAVDVIRTLLSSPKWSCPVAHSIVSILQNDVPILLTKLASMVKDDVSTPWDQAGQLLLDDVSASLFRRVNGVFLSIGGRLSRPLYEGCRCEILDGREIPLLGTVVAVESDGTIIVTTDSGATKSFAVFQSVSSLRAIDNVPLPHLSLLPFAGAILEELFKFTGIMQCSQRSSSPGPRDASLLLETLRCQALLGLSNLLAADSWSKVASEKKVLQKLMTVAVPEDLTGCKHAMPSREYERRVVSRISELLRPHSSLDAPVAHENITPSRQTFHSSEPCALSVRSATQSRSTPGPLPTAVFKRSSMSSKRRAGIIRTPIRFSPSMDHIVHETSSDNEISATFRGSFGILHCLGTRYGTMPWTNPHHLNEVKLSSTSVAPSSAPVASLLGSLSELSCEGASFCTESIPYERICIDFLSRAARLSSFTLKHWRESDQLALRSWKLEGQRPHTGSAPPSVPGAADDAIAESAAYNQQWVCIRSFTDDLSLKEKNSEANFIVESTEFFQCFRVTMTGPNSSGSWRLALGGIELYGWLRDADGTIVSVPVVKSDSTSTTPSVPVIRANGNDPLSRESQGHNRQAVMGSTNGCDPWFMFSFGKGDSGRLGQNSTASLSTPTLIPSISKVTIRQVSAFGSHCIVLTVDGKVMTFGNGDHGRLGHGDAVLQRQPRVVETLTSMQIVQVAAGNAFSLALDVSGKVWAWGQGNTGQIGDGAVTDRRTPVAVTAGGLDKVHIDLIGAGGYHAFAVASTGDLFAWGKNQCGQLGIGSTTMQKCPVPVTLPVTMSRIVQITGGWDHSLCLFNDGRVFSWGGGYELRRPVCGHGTNEKQLIPKLIEALAKEVIVQIACGWDHSIALSKRGRVYCWGGNNAGSLGNGQNSQHEFLPYRIAHELESERVVSVDGSQDHTCAVTEKGEVWTWGSAGSHLGHEDNALRTTPKRIQSCAGRYIFQTVACGQKCNFLISSSRFPHCPSHPYVFGGNNSAFSPLPPYPRSCFLVGHNVEVVNDRVADLCGVCAGTIQVYESPGAGKVLKTEQSPFRVRRDVRVCFPLSWSNTSAPRSLTVAVSFCPTLESFGTAKLLQLYCDGPRLFDVYVSLADGAHDSCKLSLNIVIDNNESHEHAFCASNAISCCEWHCLCIIVSGRQMSVYVDGIRCIKVDTITSLDDIWPTNVAASTLLEGDIRDLAYWDFALSEDHVANLFGSGLSFVEGDLKDDAKHSQHTKLFGIKGGNLNPQIQVVPSEPAWNLRNIGIKRKDAFEIRHVAMLWSGQHLKIPQAVGLASEDGMQRLTQYSVILDILLPTMPNSKQAIFRSSSEGSGPADIFVNSNGQFGFKNSFGTGRRLTPGKGSRIVIVVDLDIRNDVIIHVDGHVVLRASEHQIPIADMAIQHFFSLFADPSPEFCSVPVGFAGLQVRDYALPLSSVRELSSFAKGPLTDGRSLKTIASSLLLMGYPSHWCLRALQACDLNRRRASDWIINNRCTLLADDATEERRRSAQHLAHIGYPVEMCMTALFQTGDSVRSSIERLLGLQVHVGRQLQPRVWAQIIGCDNPPSNNAMPLSVKASVASGFQPCSVDSESSDLSQASLVDIISATTRLTSYYALRCIMSMTQNATSWSTSLTLSDLGGSHSFGAFLELASTVEEGPAVVDKFIRSLVTAEWSCGSDVQPGLLPVSHSLVQEILFLCYQACTEPWPRSDVFLQQLISLMSSLIGVVMRHPHLTAIARGHIFGNQIINMIFHCIATTSAPNRIRLIRLLSRLVEIGVINEPDTSSVHLMDSIKNGHTSKSLSPSPLLMALVEYNLAVYCYQSSTRGGSGQGCETNVYPVENLYDAARASSKRCISADLANNCSLGVLSYESESDSETEPSSFASWSNADLADIELAGESADEFLSATKTGASCNWRVVKSKQVFRSGTCQLHVRIDVDPPSTNGWKIVVGVVPPTFKINQSGSRCIGGTKGGWGYICGTGFKYHQGMSQNYGKPTTAGDIVTVNLNCDSSTVDFSLNGESFGTAFTNLSPSVQLAVCMTSVGCRVTILPPIGPCQPIRPALSSHLHWVTDGFLSDVKVWNDGKLVKIGPERWITVCSSHVVSNGCETIVFKIVRLCKPCRVPLGDGRLSADLIIGLVPEAFKCNVEQSVIGGSQGGWGYIAGGGIGICNDANNSRPTFQTSSRVAEGDSVTLHANADTGTVSFVLNDDHQIATFEDVAFPVKVAVSMCRKRTAVCAIRIAKPPTDDSPPPWFTGLLQSIYHMHWFVHHSPMKFRHPSRPHWMDDVDAAHRVCPFSYQIDSDIVVVIDRECSAIGDDALDAECLTFEPSPFDFTVFQSLNGVDISDLRHRVHLLHSFNRTLLGACPFVDFTEMCGKSPMVRAIISCKELIFASVKNELLSTALQSSVTPTSAVPEVRLELAAEFKKRSQSVFLQLFHALYSKDAKAFHVARGSRAWSCVVDECGRDNQERLYRIVLDRICNELKSPLLSLFEPDTADNCWRPPASDCLVPCRSATEQHHLAMFNFLGMLMGMSIRTGHTMNFRFPPCLWQDLTRVDQPPSSGGEKQIQAIRDGLGSIVPLGVMQVFTWLQFQQTVCGPAHIDVDLLESRAAYDGCSESTRHVSLFWSVFKKLSPENKKGFFSLISPYPFSVIQDHPTARLSICTPASADPDSCDITVYAREFRLDLPEYSSRHVMKDKILAVIKPSVDT